jgi:hypothetical protein
MKALPVASGASCPAPTRLRSLTGCNATGASTCAVFGPALGCAIEYGRKSHPRSNLKGLSGPDLSPNTQSLDPIFGVPNANGFALRAM